MKKQILYTYHKRVVVKSRIPLFTSIKYFSPTLDYIEVESIISILNSPNLHQPGVFQLIFSLRGFTWQMKLHMTLFFKMIDSYGKIQTYNIQYISESLLFRCVSISSFDCITYLEKHANLQTMFVYIFQTCLNFFMLPAISFVKARKRLV